MTVRMNEYFFICMSLVGFCVLEQITWRIKPIKGSKALEFVQVEEKYMSSSSLLAAVTPLSKYTQLSPLLQEKGGCWFTSEILIGPFNES